MTGNREVITGGDYKRMVTGAYSEFLLEYDHINKLDVARLKAGTHILHTMGAAVMPLYEVKDESIGGLSSRVAAAAVFGARGNSGVILAQLFRGLSKGLSGKLNASSSEFGKAFQYGILYAQRVMPEGYPERPFITVAKAVAKGAYHAVRANLPIAEILNAAIDAGEKAMNDLAEKDAGASVMFIFLRGCLKGLDGNFVSPAVSLSLGLGRSADMPDPRDDLVRPYCLTLRIKNTKINVPELEKQLKEFSNFALAERYEKYIAVHIHTDHVGRVMEQAVGWGPLTDIRIINMSEAHALTAHDAIMPVAALAVAANAEAAQELQKAGASVLVTGAPDKCPSVAELVSAGHSDMAASYVMVASHANYRLVFRQAKRLLGKRVELVLCPDEATALKALKAFAPDKTANENAKIMGKAAGIRKK
ncbi:MAG: DAK2 domain-containing protein [Selenomonadaceae bacterium]|nr:DAK2 domain-containing protein [Selenomonadaceae bacterium]